MLHLPTEEIQGKKMYPWCLLLHRSHEAPHALLPRFSVCSCKMPHILGLDVQMSSAGSTNHMQNGKGEGHWVCSVWQNHTKSFSKEGFGKPRSSTPPPHLVPLAPSTNQLAHMHPSKWSLPYLLQYVFWERLICITQFSIGLQCANHYFLFHVFNIPQE